MIYVPVNFKIGDFVVCHTPAAIHGISQKLANQYTGPYKIVSKQYLLDGTLVSHVFDLDHGRTRRKLKGVNIERLHR